jgi:hypothetical protein
MIATLFFRRMVGPLGREHIRSGSVFAIPRFDGMIEGQVADWTDQVAIVTASSRGIGRAPRADSALAIARRSASNYATARRWRKHPPPKLRQLAGA